MKPLSIKQVIVASLQQNEPLRMRDAIRLRLNFYQWLDTQSPKPKKQEWNSLMLTYDQLEEAIHPTLQTADKLIEGQFIVVRSCGWPKQSEQQVFKVHSTRKAAEEHGKQFYEFGDFKIMSHQVFLHTPQGKNLQSFQTHLARLRSVKKFKPSKNKPTKKPSTISKAKLDTINHLQSEILKLSVKGDLMGVARLQQQIRKIKAQ